MYSISSIEPIDHDVRVSFHFFVDLFGSTGCRGILVADVYKLTGWGLVSEDIKDRMVGDHAERDVDYSLSSGSQITGTYNISWNILNRGVFLSAPFGMMSGGLHLETQDLHILLS
ncbi:hypothetical protein MPER_03284 [Moniliophthora perniciosa FA553]|nr:hypothetical protein MPER_03284 [Moniliophthora perniciosa FA553]